MQGSIPQTARSGREPKSRVGRLTDGATQAPPILQISKCSLRSFPASFGPQHVCGSSFPRTARAFVTPLSPLPWSPCERLVSWGPGTESGLPPVGGWKAAHTCLFRDCAWLLSCYSRAEKLCQGQRGPQSLKCLLSWVFAEKVAHPLGGVIVGQGRHSGFGTRMTCVRSLAQGAHRFKTTGERQCFPFFLPEMILTQ